MIDHEKFDWGVRLTTKPFAKTRLDLLTIQSEIRTMSQGKAPQVRITFTGVALNNPLRVPDAEAWREAMGAIVAETRTIVMDLKAADKPPKKR
jgi:hypothetical protein